MRRPLVRFAVPFVVGICISFVLLPLLRQIIIAAAVVALPGFISVCLLRCKRPAPALACAALAVGILWSAVYSRLILAPCESLAGTERPMTMVLADYPKETEQGTQCYATVDGVPGKVILYSDKALPGLVPGDVLEGTMKCYSAAEVGGRRSFSYLSRGIFLRLYPVGEITVREGENGTLSYLPQHFSRLVAETAKKTYDEETFGMVLALLTGERNALSDRSRSDLAESGLMHLTAVSGLHCGFLIALVGLLLGGGSWRTFLVGYPLLLVYMVSVGCTPSVVRATVMVFFVLCAPLLGRESDLPTSIASSAILILLVNPFAIGSVSFQLSYAAVIGICLVSRRVFGAIFPVVKCRRKWARRLWAFVVGSVSATLGALVFTVPISAYWFRTVSLVAPLSNLLVLFVVQILFGVSLIVTLLCAAVPSFAVLSAVPALLSRYVLGVAAFTASLPGHAVAFHDGLSIAWLIFVYGMMLLCAATGKGRRKYAFAAVLAVLTLMIVRNIPAKQVKDDAMTMVAVDVGQGAATLIHSGGKTVLIDCGSHFSERGCGAAVADVMESYGWDSLQYVVLTHYHRDHAGGIVELLPRVRVEMLLLPWETESNLQTEVIEAAERHGVKVRRIYMTNTVDVGDARLTVYPQLTRGETNEEGLTVICSLGEFDAVFTGDMAASTERLLIERYDLRDAEVLFVGHHGSKYSTSEEFLKTITPEIGIISVGENSYGHPSHEAMERMAFYGMELYRTDWQGNILIRVHE